MTPETVIRQAAAQGVWVALSPPDNIKVVGNENAVDRWLPMIREHKPGILAALKEATTDPLPDPAAEARRQRVLAMLAKRPCSRYAVVVDNPDTDPVILALAIRDKGTCELRIPAAKFDAFVLIDLIGRHGGRLQ